MRSTDSIELVQSSDLAALRDSAGCLRDALREHAPVDALERTAACLIRSADAVLANVDSDPARVACGRALPSLQEGARW